MYERRIHQCLTDWSGRETRKPLILRGARQVGKTTIVKSFAENYELFLGLNLEIKADRDLFEQDYSIDQLISAIHFHLGKPANQNVKTLLFIDEIQCSPQAAAILRYFYEERNEIHVIAAGSLLESLIDRHISFPVGRVEYLFMHPMSFSEYLLAANETQALEFLQQYPVPDFAHSKLLDLFHAYTLVGGMPEAVAAFLKDKDIQASNVVYRNLMIGFMDDVEKYASNAAMARVIRYAMAQAPIECGARIRFEGFGHSNYKSREIGEALRTLEKAMLLKLVYPTTDAMAPAAINTKKSPKLQFLDTGMVNHAANLQSYYFKLNDLNALHTGRIVENIVGQELLATHFVREELKFWVREKPQSNAEVDYVIPYEQYLIPIEVKAGVTVRLKSLMQYMELANHAYAVRLYAGKIQTDSLKTPSGKPFQLLSLPYYLTGELERYVAEMVSPSR